jgi:hypothetical protein
LSEPRTCAKTNARLTAGVPSAFKHPRPVGVDDANPRCSAQSRLGGRAPQPCKPPQTASRPPWLLLPPLTTRHLPAAFGPSHHRYVSVWLSIHVSVHGTCATRRLPSQHLNTVKNNSSRTNISRRLVRIQHVGFARPEPLLRIRFDLNSLHHGSRSPDCQSDMLLRDISYASL